MPRRAKPEARGQSAPAWQNPADCALWHLSLILRDISQSKVTGAAQTPPCQAPAEDALKSDSQEGSSDE